MCTISPLTAATKTGGFRLPRYAGYAGYVGYAQIADEGGRAGDWVWLHGDRLYD